MGLEWRRPPPLPVVVRSATPESVLAPGLQPGPPRLRPPVPVILAPEVVPENESPRAALRRLMAVRDVQLADGTWVTRAVAIAHTLYRRAAVDGNIDALRLTYDQTDGPQRQQIDMAVAVVKAYGGFDPAEV